MRSGERIQLLRARACPSPVLIKTFAREGNPARCTVGGEKKVVEAEKYDVYVCIYAAIVSSFGELVGGMLTENVSVEEGV